MGIQKKKVWLTPDRGVTDFKVFGRAMLVYLRRRVESVGAVAKLAVVEKRARMNSANMFVEIRRDIVTGVAAFTRTHELLDSPTDQDYV